MRAVMCFQMGALCVGFPTANVVTCVCGNPLPGPGAPATLGLRFLRQTVTTGNHERLCGVEKTW